MTDRADADRRQPDAPGSEPAARSVFATIRASLGSLLAQMTLMSVFINVLALAPPVFVLQVYDRVVPHASYETLKGLFIGVVILIVFDFILRQARSRLVQMIAMRVDVDLTRRLFARLSGASLQDLEARSDVEWRTLLRDGDVVRDTVAGPAAILVVDLPFILISIAAIALVAPPLAWVLLALTPVYIGLAIAASFVVGRASAAENDALQEKSRLTDEIVAGRGTVKALGLGGHFQDRWEAAQARTIRRAIHRGADADGFTHVGGSLAMMTTVLLTTIGAVAIIDQQMSIGGLIAANMLASRIVQPLMQLISVWRNIERFRESAQRLNAVFETPIEPARGVIAMPRPIGRLTLENVEFTYPGAGAPTLTRITGGFKPGTVTGVVGANGGGKSTLLKVLQGLYAPSAGRVLLDGADLAQFGRDELTDWFGYLPQEPFLFAGSIRDNIAKGRADLDDAAIRAAADQAMVTDFVKELPDGFGFNVGEGGRRLPPGHRQRVALARALVDTPPVLVLDEPSANLDFQSETALCEKLDALKQDRTVIVVSHARPLLESCDTIVILSQGRIVMAGRAEDVLPSPAARAVDQPTSQSGGAPASAPASKEQASA